MSENDRGEPVAHLQDSLQFDRLIDDDRPGRAPPAEKWQLRKSRMQAAEQRFQIEFENYRRPTSVRTSAPSVVQFADTADGQPPIATLAARPGCSAAWLMPK